MDPNAEFPEITDTNEDLSLIRRRFPPVPDELIKFVKSGDSFIVTGHREPDGDCIGSQLALQSAIKRLGKKAVVLSAGPFNRTELRNYIKFFDTTPDDLKAENYPKGTKVIIVDCSTMERIGDIRSLLDNFPMAIIDHHRASNHPASSEDSPVYVDAEAPSCTILIYKLISSLGLKLTEEEATLLLFGLCTDTGFYRHLTEKNADVFEAAAKMIRYGASPKKIFHITNGGKSLKSRILIGNILTRSQSFFDGRLLVSYETLEDFNSFGIESRDSDSLYHLLMSIEGVEAIVIIRQECADNCTVSLRSSDIINVSQVAASFGGGGHKNAAGLTLKGDISYAKEIMLESFKKIFAC
ncbi:MAG: bifunctional oligoribonuclease/PAP phosphatase NrnA [Treponema sp.]|nr:bifunctional oligoribonuclease/PAP phosphatase NrnA [Treponema sp.]